MSPNPTPADRSAPSPFSSPTRWGPEKITAEHLERLAVVYVRQSHPQQLIRHPESTEMQYNLKLRAGQLGWPSERILVVDDDQGQTASSAEAAWASSTWSTRSAWVTWASCSGGKPRVWRARVMTGIRY